MIQLLRIIVSALINTGLIGTNMGIGIAFGALILGVTKNSSLRSQLYSYAILNFSFAKAIRLLIFILVLLFSTPDLCLDHHPLNFIADDEQDPYNDEDKEWEMSGLDDEDHELYDDLFDDEYDSDDDEDYEDDCDVEDEDYVMEWWRIL